MPIITERTYVERVLIVLAPDGTVKGAHVERLQEYLDEAGAIVTARQLPAEVVAIEALSSVLPDTAALIGQVAAMKTQADAEAAGRAAEIDALRRDLDAARAECETLRAAGAGGPEPSPVTQISRRQFYQQLAVAGFVTSADALAAVRAGILPPALAQAVGAIADSDARFTAEMLLCGAATFDRAHPLVASMGAALGQTPEQIDAFFAAAAAL